MDEHRSMQRSDWVAATAMFAVACFSIFIIRDIVPDKVTSKLPYWGDIAITAALHVPLAWRRVRPLWVAGWVGPLFALYRYLEVPEPNVSSLAIFLAIFAAGAYSDAPARHLLRGVAVAFSALALLYSIFGQEEFVGFDGLTLAALSLAINAGFFAAAWLLGDAWRRRRIDAAELARRADQLAVEREARARRAVLDERVRIARELHDVVAHHVSVMGVQAAGARRILDSDPERAADALASVEQSSREAVTELHRLVGFLRSEDDETSIEPQPTIEDLDELIARVGEAGLPVEVRRIGKAQELPLAVGLSAYRIVQEALTNVIKHAGSAPTTVIVSYLDNALEIQVVNTRGPSGGTPSGTSGGRGHLGMRERATMVGGDLSAGPNKGGGYRVAARLPTEGIYQDGMTA
ncbi:MAG: histidine kinase [Acidimicrobiia bacterium]|nr:histidine kinase [Acidimicrobiia bacterium]